MLEVINVSKHFGGVRAVDGVSITAKQGKILGLVGPNGAGKTTLFNVITGFLKLDSGQILFKGKDITNYPAWRIALEGIARTFQTPVGFPKMTVLENLMVFAHHHYGENLLDALTFSRRSRSQDKVLKEKALALLESVGLVDKRNHRVSDLSAGELKILEIIRPLMTDPEMLLLDEPAAGVNPSMLYKLAQIITSLKERGMTFLIVDHNFKFILEITDLLAVMANGKLVASGFPQEVADDPVVIEIYLGTSTEKRRGDINVMRV